MPKRKFEEISKDVEDEVGFPAFGAIQLDIVGGNIVLLPEYQLAIENFLLQSHLDQLEIIVMINGLVDHPGEN